MSSTDNKLYEPSTSSSSSVQWSQPCRHIDFSEILKATENFDKSLVIGTGGFGKVYKGNVTNGGASVVVAAIKRLDPESSQGPEEFWAEVKMLSMLRHRNIVWLIGYCIHEYEKILVYEYMPNGTLDDHLHRRGTPLSWLRRLNICVGAAFGLRYLHNDVEIDSGVIHRDFKSSNVLLHESWAAKISDFGLSKTCRTNQTSTHVNTLVKGSFGYFDPNYFKTGKLTRKSDVYAFGVVLFEVLCRKPAVERRVDGEWRNLATWAQDSIKDGNLKHIIDSGIWNEISQKCLKKFVRIAERCLHENPDHRPTMAEVVVSLEAVVALQERLNMQAANSRTIFGRMVDMLPFPSNRENSVQGDSKLSNDCNNINMSPEMNKVPVDFQSPSPSVKVLKFSDLQKSTRNFSRDLLLVEGGSGKTLFLGWVDKNTLAPSKQGVGIAVAVKRLILKQYTGELFVGSYDMYTTQAELNFLGYMAHPNIIRLLGYYSDEYECLLVYDYMSNKSFDRFLVADGHVIAEPLSWGTRLLIMIRVARGIAYLHSRKLVHHHLKPSTILLDEDFNAKLGGFGFVKYCPGTMEAEKCSTLVKINGYLDPHYMKTGQFTMKYDIYSFGVVLLESITCRSPLDGRRPKGQQNLVEWASQIQSSTTNLKKIMDPRLKGNYPPQGAFECVALALRCAAKKPVDRPSSEEVLQSLENIYAQWK